MAGLVTNATPSHPDPGQAAYENPLGAFKSGQRLGPWSHPDQADRTSGDPVFQSPLGATAPGGRVPAGQLHTGREMDRQACMGEDDRGVGTSEPRGPQEPSWGQAESSPGQAAENQPD